MDILTAAAFFDDTLCVDTFVPSTSFKGQLDLYDDSRRDGTTVSRRILSLSPDIAIPARRMLTIHGEQWIVGMREYDSFNSVPVRAKYVLHRADAPALIRTSAELVSTGGVATYAARIWIKDLKELEVSSRFEGFYNIYMPSTEVVVVGDLVTVGSESFRVRNAYQSAAGFLVAESDKLEASVVVAATYSHTVYSPALDAFTGGTTQSISLIVMRWQTDFSLDAPGADKYEAGDVKGVVVKAGLTPAPKAGDRVTFNGVTWNVLSIDNEDPSWGLHLRPVA